MLEMRCCSPTLLPPVVAELHSLGWGRGESPPTALSQPRWWRGEHRALSSQAPCWAARAEEARPPPRLGAVSGLPVPTGTPKQSLCLGYCLALSAWKSWVWRTLPLLSHKTPPEAKQAKVPQPQSPHGCICWSSAFPVGSFPRIGGEKGPF